MLADISTTCIWTAILVLVTIFISTSTYNTGISANTTLGADQTSNNQMAVENFQEYLRIRTEQPHPDYKGAMEFLKRMAGELGVAFKTIEPVANKPVAIMTWEGVDTSLPTIMLNSHTDVVAVFEKQWMHDPFAADRVLQENGDYKIFARGAQDMKVVGISYIEAIRRLKQTGWKPPRTIHLTFMPDEELGGLEGMSVFCKTPEFKALNVGFVLDEGQPSPDNDFILYYAERIGWPFKLHAYGNTGHGSQFIQNTASEKLMSAINEFMLFRKQQEDLLKNGKHDGKQMTLGDVTTINLTVLKGGVQSNMVPSNLTAEFDLRITPHTDLDKFSQWIEGVARKHNVTLEFSKTRMRSPGKTVPGNDSKWQKAFDKTSSEFNVNIRREIFPAGTDARYLRTLGLPAIGISPINNTPILLHSDDEFVYESVFLKGITFYEVLIKHLVE
ncbi:hypothetical protein BDF22DRAFT_682981 [Syncephalis plumigaleata]|nr:hypothetical protein BDF22DRAFT_682981 [Syncephalis plumigaleata]